MRLSRINVGWGWILLAYLAATYYRSPLVIRYPRFWAEDGSIYFLQALAQPWTDSILSRPLGYLSLPANLAGIISSSITLKLAPYGSLAVSLGIQLLYAIAILSNGYFKYNRVKQLIIILFPLVIAQSAETWLNPINSPFWLALSSAIILASNGDSQSKLRITTNLITLLLAGISSPIAAFLSPLFVLRAAISKQFIWLFYSGLASSGGLIIFFSKSGEARPLSFPLEIFATEGIIQIISNNLCLPCSSKILTLARNHPELLIYGLPLIMVAYGLNFWLSKQQGRWLVAASFTLLSLSFAGMLGKNQIIESEPLMNSRYFFAPSALFFSAFLFHTRKFIPYSLLAILLLNGLRAAITLPVVGERDGLFWRENATSLSRSETDIMYFAYRFCAFSPTKKEGLLGSSASIHINQKEIALFHKKPKNNPDNIYLFRSKKFDDNGWQSFSETWEKSGFFVGVERLTLCYGGPLPKSVAETKLMGSWTYRIPLEDLGNTKGYQYLVGFGENVGAMLARGDYSRFDGDAPFSNP